MREMFNKPLNSTLFTAQCALSTDAQILHTITVTCSKPYV